MQKRLFFVLFLLLFQFTHAQETLPPYHWANDYIDYFKVRGMLPALSVIDRPYSRQDVARQLLFVEKDEINDSRQKQMFRLLIAEFSPELRRMGEGNVELGNVLRGALEFLQMELLPEIVDPQIKMGFFGEVISQNRSGGGSETGNDIELDLHPVGGIFWPQGWTLFNNTRILTDPDGSYIGKEFNDLFAYTEQGYAAYDGGFLKAKIGRDFMQIGPGRRGQLLISDNSRTFDLYHLQLGSGFLRYRVWGFLLDEIAVRDSLTNQALAANRYLNGHRISLHFGNKLHVGLSEVVVYGGPGRGWDLRFMNPVGIYYAHNVNMSSPQNFGNIFYSLDWDYYPTDNLEVYGEFLLDDIQLENEKPQDLEPSEYAILLGANYADPVGVSGLLLNLEYAQVRNRTYNALDNSWEKYLHRLQEIGHYLGNDFYVFDAGLTYWALPNLQVGATWSMVRNGEGTVAGEFNTDYLNFTIDEGYEEDFPFGVVEKRNQWGLTMLYRPRSFGHVTLDILRSSIDDFAHIEGLSRTDTYVNIKLWLEWQKIWSRR